jgi:hypothetical protein
MFRDGIEMKVEKSVACTAEVNGGRREWKGVKNGADKSVYIYVR